MLFQEVIQPIADFLNSVFILELMIGFGIAAWFGIRFNSSFVGLFVVVSSTIILENQSMAWDNPISFPNIFIWVLIHSSLVVFCGFLAGYLAKCVWENLFEGWH